MKLLSVWRKLSHRDQRALRLGGLIIGLGLSWALGISPWIDAVSDRMDRLASQRHLLQAELDLLQSRRSITHALESATERVEKIRGSLLRGPSEGIAAAELQQLVRDQARSQNVLIIKATPRPARQAGEGLLAIEMDVSAKSDLEGIARFISSLERAPPLLRLSNMRIQRDQSGRQGQGVLTLAASVTGFLLDRDQRREQDLELRRPTAALSQPTAASRPSRRLEESAR